MYLSHKGNVMMTNINKFLTSVIPI